MHYNGETKNSYKSNGLGSNKEHRSDSEESLDLLKLLNILFLHKWTFFTIVLVFTLTAMIGSLFLTPIYESHGTIMISESKNRYSYAGSDLENLLTTTYGIGVGSTIANELQIFKSRKLSTELAKRIIDLEFDESGNKFPILWREYPYDSTTTSIDTVASRFRSVVLFDKPDASADIVSIVFESPLPTEASTIINLTMNTYSDLSTEQNRTMAISALDFLKEERAKIQSELKSAEDSLQKFMNKTQIIDIDAQGKELINNLSNIVIESQKIEVSLVAAQAGIESYEKQLDEIKPGLADQYSSALSAILERYQYALAELETNKMLLESKNPEISDDNPEIMRLNNEINNVKDRIKTKTDELLSGDSDLLLSFITSQDGGVTQKVSSITQTLLDLKLEHAQYLTQKEFLQERKDEQNARFDNLPDNIIELTKLKRDVRVNEEMYLQVTSQYSEMSLWEKTQFGLGRPLDYAIPSLNPVKPKKKVITILGFLAGCVLGLVFVFLKELLNDRITSTDILKDYRTPILGSIPDFNIIGELNPAESQYIGDRAVSNQLITFFDHISPISESYRRLRINVVYANPDKHYKVLMITSATKGEGKSTVAANLAITFTGSDKKVLIIDLDLRRPTQHKIFGENREPGLTDILFGTSSKDQVIRSTVAPNVDLITVGRKTPEPASVLDSRRLKQLIDELSADYDHIILDTAPYGIISDSASLLRLVDGLVVVSRFNVTTKRELSFTLEGLSHLNADVVGVVLNAFNPKKSTDYYTNYNYYQRTYSDYYKYKD
ncbi:GumC family protein [Gelidibacter japonicus]|uniref:GumC family protein n=1 Tax=Gelidibacter japonicus TaxID=1962232 RepID=UPI003A91A789